MRKCLADLIVILEDYDLLLGKPFNSFLRELIMSSTIRAAYCNKSMLTKRFDILFAFRNIYGIAITHVFEVRESIKVKLLQNMILRNSVLST